MEVHRPSAAVQLVHLRTCFDPGRPTKGKPERRPFKQCTFVERACRGQMFFTERGTERIAQVTDHLMCRHRSPAALILGPTPSSRESISFRSCALKRDFIRHVESEI